MFHRVIQKTIVAQLFETRCILEYAIVATNSAKFHFLAHCNKLIRNYYQLQSHVGGITLTSFAVRNRKLRQKVLRVQWHRLPDK